MPKYLKTSSKNFEKEFYDILENKAELSEEIDVAVRQIIKEVRAKGDEALINYTNKYDINKLTIETIKISSNEIDNIFDKCDKETIEALLFAYKRIYAHHSKNLPKDHQYIDELGVELGTRWTPIESVGIYVPGGKANYPSSVLMNAVPAIVAGASRIAMAVPSMNDNLNPLVIAAAKICGITEIYKIGGAQAIAALAYGTETIEAVDLIVGPGNKYVAAAKKQVFGKVGIDMIAGPSELLVIGDSESNVNWIAADLIAQAEHDEEAQSIFVTTNREIAKQVDKAVASLLENNLKDSIANKSWKNKGVIILCNSDQEIVNIVNKIAPEHLELNVNNVEYYEKNIRNAGAIFKGIYTPEAIGDYVAGTNHVLPTARSARYTSGLGVMNYMKRTSIITCNSDNLNLLAPKAIQIARAEGLHAHAESLAIRLNIDNLRSKI